MSEPTAAEVALALFREHGGTLRTSDALRRGKIADVIAGFLGPVTEALVAGQPFQQR
jgi:hypothetical protein